MRRPSPLILALSPIVVALVAAIGVAGVKAAGLAVDLRVVGWAAAVAVLAGELAMVPPLLARHGDQMQASQAGLIATVVHLMVAAGAGLAVASVVKPGPAFMWWLCAFFWATLGGVSVVVVPAVRSAPVHRGA